MAHNPDYFKKLRKTRESQGVCACGRSQMEGSKRCEKCYTYHMEYSKKRIKYRNENKLCYQCGQTIDGNFKTCSFCRERGRLYQRGLRDDAIKAYGGYKCVCCGENGKMFLCIDHINNDGNVHRKELGKTNIYAWLRDNEYPNGFQVLCYNCNYGKHLNGGACPHNY